LGGTESSSLEHATIAAVRHVVDAAAKTTLLTDSLLIAPPFRIEST
jgi:hypothetical protein